MISVSSQDDSIIRTPPRRFTERGIGTRSHKSFDIWLSIEILQNGTSAVRVCKQIDYLECNFCTVIPQILRTLMAPVIYTTLLFPINDAWRSSWAQKVPSRKVFLVLVRLEWSCNIIREIGYGLSFTSNELSQSVKSLYFLRKKRKGMREGRK